MEYAPGDLKPRERYRVLTSFVLPRPIAWVTTLGPTGVVNAAPFSFFNVFCEDPPLCMFAVNRRPDGRVKDTLVNIERTGEFVVNLTDEPLAQAMHESSGDFPPDIGEPDFLNLKLAPSTKITVPRRRALCDGVQDLEDHRRQRRPGADHGRRHQLLHPRRIVWDREAMRVHMERYHRSAACSPTVTAGRTTGWFSPRPRARGAHD